MSHYYEHEDSSKIKLRAKRVRDNKLVHADNTNKKEGPFYCPETKEELIVRKCLAKRNHFAYKSRQSPIGSKESELHNTCKREICAILKEKFPKGLWEIERQVFKKDKDKGYAEVKPDISGRIEGKKGQGVIIEVQKSTLSVKDIIHRTKQYSMRGGVILWIVPLEEELGIENFRPRFFEKYLHAMYYGRIYYWVRGQGTILTPVHFGTAKRYIEESNWFEEDGTERNEGGYYKPYKNIKKPIYGQKVDLVNFKFCNREEFKYKKNNKELTIPKSKIFKDTLDLWWGNNKSKDKTMNLKESKQ